MKIYRFFAWYDLWVGFFWDKSRRRLYFCPLPCCVILFQFPTKRKWTVAGLIDLSDTALKRERAMLAMEKVRIMESLVPNLPPYERDERHRRFADAEAQLEVIERELRIRKSDPEELGREYRGKVKADSESG